MHQRRALARYRCRPAISCHTRRTTITQSSDAATVQHAAPTRCEPRDGHGAGQSAGRGGCTVSGTAYARTTPAAPKPRSAPLVPWMLFSSHSSSMLASQRGLVAGAARPDGWRNTHLLSAMRDRLRIFTVASSAAARVLLSRSRGAASAWTEDLCSFSSRSVCSHFRSNPVVQLYRYSCRLCIS